MINCNIYPRPQSYVPSENTVTVPSNFVVLFENDKNGEMFRIISKFCSSLKNRNGIDCYPVADFAGKLDVFLRFIRDGSLNGEKYTVSVTESGITVKYGTFESAFRAQETLVQMLGAKKDELECCEIVDFPDVRRRGFMLDISRSKVPTLEKLFYLVDVMAMMKMNELQLYIEQFVYEYQDFPEYAHEVDALTPLEIMKLEKYAHENYIDLVPNQNSFGHLGAWFYKPEFKKLSNGCGALDPINPESIEFVRKLHTSLLPCFHSELVHIGCDEVAGLDQGPSKEKAEEIGVVGVYTEFVNKVNKIVTDHGRRAMFWGDVVLENNKNPELISLIGKDMIPIIWRYGDLNEFEEKAEILSPLGYDFYLCPSTNCWSNMFSNLNVAQKNMLHAAETAVKFSGKGAYGVLIAEWGDFCHLQFDFPTLLALSYGAGVTWALESNRDIEYCCEFSDREIFKLPDIDVKVSDLVRRGADHYDVYLYSIAYNIDNFDFFTDPKYPMEKGRYEKMKSAMIDIAADAEKIPERDDDTILLKQEIICSAKISEIFTEYLLLRVEYHDNGNIADYESRIEEMRVRTEELKNQVIYLWSKRNKPHGSNKAMWFLNYKLEALKKFLDKQNSDNIESK